MNSFRFNRLIQIIYPFLIYTIIYALSDYAFAALLPKNSGDIVPLFFASLVTLPFIVFIYKKAPVVRAEKLFEKKDILRDLALILFAVLTGLILNIIISHLPITELSEGFKAASHKLSSGNTWIKLLTTCISVPLLEEVLYRGIIAGQLYVWYRTVPAMFISSFLFGIMHMNMIQFIYAFLTGMALSYIYLKTKKLWTTIAAHSLLNFIVFIYSLFIV